jgi:putative tricarboxylic transport membrane protein
MVRVRSPRDAAAGILFILFAAMLAYNTSGLEMGTAARMGAGYFPRLLAGLLVVLGLSVLANAFRYDGPALPRGDWKGLALVTAAIAVFGATVEPLGFIIAVLLCSILCVVSSRPVKPVSSTILVIGLVGFCTAVFVWGLGMPVHLLPSQ